MRSPNHGFLARICGQFALLLLGVLQSGCGPSFDPPDQLKTLRILGVHKDIPYAKPGDRVKLTMLWEDAAPSAGRPVQIAWSGPCVDPAGDLYYGCFAQSSLLAGLASGDTTTVTIPDSYTPPGSTTPQPIVRPATTENNAPYGLVYVFYAACAGTLAPIETSDRTAFPFACKDDAGNLLGSDDFVAGYTSIYVFSKFSNQNPVISGFEFNGKPLASDQFCVGDECLEDAGSSAPDPTSIHCDMDDPRCIPSCADDGKSSCHGYALKPTLAQADNQEQDSVSAQLLGRNVTEQMWVDYYADGGGFKSPARLLNDATSGWNDNYGTDYYASKDKKISRIWALAHDNRGGVEWAGISLQTQ